jgi:hypothetical protein
MSKAKTIAQTEQVGACGRRSGTKRIGLLTDWG